MKNKPAFFCGLGENQISYKSIEKYVDIVSIDWNNIEINRLKADTVIGFSFGGILACEYALKYKVKTLILCSMTTGVETLSSLNVDKIIFIVGEKEKWVIKDIHRLRRGLNCPSQIFIVHGADHKLIGKYRSELLKLIREEKSV